MEAAIVNGSQSEVIRVISCASSCALLGWQILGVSCRGLKFSGQMQIAHQMRIMQANGPIGRVFFLVLQFSKCLPLRAGPRTLHAAGFRAALQVSLWQVFTASCFSSRTRWRPFFQRWPPGHFGPV